jgi:outer membrane immunogenic protein
MHHIKLGILAGTAIGLLTGLAQAADLPVRAPVYKAPVVSYDPWTGVYVGGNIGYSWGHIDSSATTSPFSAGLGDFPGWGYVAGLKPDGIIAGGQIGYNYRFASYWLAGIEADIQWSGEKDSGRFSGSGSIGFCSGQSCEFNNTTDITAKLSWFGTLRGRFGFLVNEAMLLYATGGLAYGKVSISGVSNTDSFIDPGLLYDSYFNSFSYSKTKIGYVFGGGIEGRFQKRGWTWKIEYIHLDLGSIGGGSSGSDPAILLNTSKFTDDIVRFGINVLLWGKGGPT